MSSDEEGYDGLQAKKRKVQRACDICRRKKIRCDGNQMPGLKCSSCVAYDLECTYQEAAKKRGPPKASVHFARKFRNEKAKALAIDTSKAWRIEWRPWNGYFVKIQLMSPEEFAREVSPFSSPPETARDITPRLRSPMLVDKVVEEMQKLNPVVQRKEEGKEEEPQEEADGYMVSHTVPGLAITSDQRFYGKSSNALLLRKAVDMRREYTENRPNVAQAQFVGIRRQEYWQTLRWELDFIRKFEPTAYMFPEPDLLQHLVDLFFKHINVFIPLLHRPTFLRQLEQGLHHREEGFGAVVLLVCANASRYSNDPRVRLDGEESWLSSGWKWFDQVQLVRKALLSPPSLYDLQFYYVRIFAL
ncbi:Gypsy retrotransposon integrase-like protein 1 [Marasmius tenuissimus]|uniref:Gypsy retrotransposon integrase-like protein 1 n=1 Tax=Marasmius tenuissimus TaxID=585030 RepID=A0ABR2ZDN2_9AGAR